MEELQYQGDFPARFETWQPWAEAKWITYQANNSYPHLAAISVY